MIDVKVDVTDKMTGQIEAIKKKLRAVPKDAHKEFVALTPIRSGNARRNTTLSGDTIQAHYPYADRLDNGWSKQAPRGMTLPFEKWFRNRIKQIMGK